MNTNFSKIGDELIRVKQELDDLTKSITEAGVDVGDNFTFCLLRAKAEILGAKAALSAKEADAGYK